MCRKHGSEHHSLIIWGIFFSFKYPFYCIMICGVRSLYSGRTKISFQKWTSCRYKIISCLLYLYKTWSNVLQSITKYLIKQKRKEPHTRGGFKKSNKKIKQKKTEPNKEPRIDMKLIGSVLVFVVRKLNWIELNIFIF